MSRFADPKATERYALGPCECPDAPHVEGDWLELRTQPSGLELMAMQTANVVDRMEILIVDWNLIDGADKAPIDREHLSRLSLPTLNAIGDWWSRRVEGFVLPNGSAAPSRASSRGSGSRRRNHRKVNSSTTPSWPVDAASATTTSGTTGLSS